jgi:uncharacterized OsmC-like protein
LKRPNIGGSLVETILYDKRRAPVRKREHPWSIDEETAVNAEQLRGLQAPLKTLYRDDPRAALVTLRARGALGPDSITCAVDTGKGPVSAGLHPATGGDGRAACSADMLLQSLVACAGVTLGAVALALGLTVRGGTVSAEGDLDFRGTLGVSKEAPVGFETIRLRFELDTDATEEQIANLLRLTERYCVVLQTLKHPPGLSASIVVAGRAGDDPPG